MAQETEYYAFISYSHSDEKWARWIQNRIERFSIPIGLRKNHSNIPKRFYPCFRDKTDIGINILSDELKCKLDKSIYLIVVCSPLSATSSWVGKEINYFIKTGKRNNIIPFIVAGSPYSNDDDECYHKVLKDAFPQNRQDSSGNELLGASIYANGKTNSRIKRMAFVRIVAKLCNVSFDELWNRNNRRKKHTISTIFIIGLFFISALGSIIHSIMPEKIRVKLNEVSFHNVNLPELRNASVTIYYKNKEITDSSKTILKKLSDIEYLTNIPSSLIGNEARLVFECDDYARIDTVMEMKKKLDINIRRNDSVYGYINLLLSDDESGNPLTNTEICVNNDTFITDASGVLRCMIPLQRQKTVYEFTRKYSSNKKVTLFPIYDLKNLYKTNTQYIFALK